MERRIPRLMHSAVRLLAVVLCTALLSGCMAPVRTAEPDSPAVPERSPEVPRVAPAQRVAEATPELAPRVPEPIARSRTGDEVFARLVQRFADPPCVEDRVVQRWERAFSRWPPRFAANLERALPLIELVSEELELFGLPGEFAMLPLVESWYHPAAGNRAAGAGMWQFGSATGRGNGLRTDASFDERFAPAAATRAAAAHLAGLHNRFGDWKLATMAFNAGEYRLARVLARSGGGPMGLSASAQAHQPAGLALGTYEHLAKAQALACLIAEPGRFGIGLPGIAVIDPLVLASIDADYATLDQVADRAGMPRDQLAALNPAFPGRRIGPRTPRQALLPQSAAHRLAMRAASDRVTTSARPSASPRRIYHVKLGDTLSAIAARFGLSLSELLHWNRLDPDALLQPGQKIGLEPGAR